VFLHHAKKAGLDFYIAKPEKIPAYEEIPYRMCCLLEDVVLSRVPDAKKKLAAALKAM
jgi:cobalamin-dependent methionine synthase I